MRISIIVALVLLSAIAMHVAEAITIENLKKADFSSFNTTFSTLTLKSQPKKRDLNPDKPFSFQIYYDSSNDIVSHDITFSGEPINIGFNKKSGSLVYVTATRYYSYGSIDATKASTTLVFDIDLNGKDIAPQNNMVNFNIFNLDYQNKGTVEVNFYAWTYDNTGTPAIYKDVTTTQQSFNGHYSISLPNIGGHGFTRFSIVFALLDSKSSCPRSIENHSLLETACVPPAKNNKPRETTITAGQIFQDAGKLLSKNLKYHIRNCDGYDQKVCQTLSDDIANNFVNFDENSQVFSFGKPCQGIPKGYHCVTTVEIEILPFQDGDKTCKKHVRSKVLLPVNDRSLKNKYGKAICKILPKEGDYNPTFYTNENKQCAHYVGCYDYLQFTGVVFTTELNIGGGDDGAPVATFEPPFSVSQCKSICLDNGATHAAIYNNGYQCTCLNGPNYGNPTENSVCKDPITAACLSDMSFPGETCGTDVYALVYNLDECNKKIKAGHNFAGTPVVKPEEEDEDDESCVSNPTKVESFEGLDTGNFVALDIFDGEATIDKGRVFEYGDWYDFVHSPPQLFRIKDGLNALCSPEHISTITFNSPIKEFGGYFGNVHLSPVIEFSFFDSDEELIHKEEFYYDPIDADSHMLCYSYKSSSNNIKSIKITGFEQVFDEIQFKREGW